MYEKTGYQPRRQYRYYKLLGLTKAATRKEIASAYCRLAKKYHPDVNNHPGATERFKIINEVYEALSNSTRRTEYDNSPAECPFCWTHDVFLLRGTKYRCRIHNHTFDTSLREKICPTCKRPLLFYNSSKKNWKCFNCDKSFVYKPKRQKPKSTPSKEICPNCKNILFHDTEMLLWRCKNRNCRRIYTYADLNAVHKEKKQYEQKDREYSSGTSYEKQSTHKTSYKKRSRKNSIPSWLIAALIIFIMIIFGLVFYYLGLFDSLGLS